MRGSIAETLPLVRYFEAIAFSRFINRLFNSACGTSGSVSNVGGGYWVVSTTCKRCTSAPNCRETASAYGIAFNDRREKSMGTKIRLNRRDRDVATRGRGFRLRRVGIGGSSRVFMPQYCCGHRSNAPQQLLNARRFLFQTVWQPRGTETFETRFICLGAAAAHESSVREVHG
jgi:hypothetical protein